MAQPFIVEKKRKRRKPSYRKKSGVYATPASWVPTSTGKTRVSVLRAAEIFAEQARRNASVFSRRIPAATAVEAREEQQAMVVTDGSAAPNAAPFEFGERHPVNARDERPRSEWKWGKQPKRDYMNRAATNSGTIDQAAEIYAQAEQELLAEEHDYNQ